MIEEEMVFALGFLSAGLLALACLPAVWRRAIRLTTRRLTQLVPLSMDEIVAERDGLRAGFAIEQRKLEQRLEATELTKAEMLVQSGRKDARIAFLEDEAAETEARIVALTAEFEATTRELRDVRCETGAAAVALHDLSGLAEQRHWEVLAAEEKVRRQQSTIDEGRAAIASLETRILGLDSRITDLDRALGNSRAELARTVQAVSRAVAERDAARQAAQSAVVARTGDRPPEIPGPTGAANASENRAAVQTQAAPAQDATVDMRARQEALEAQLAMQAEAARADAAKLQQLRIDNVALEMRIAALPAQRPSDSDEAELAVLREAIRTVAADVLRMTETPRHAREPAPKGSEAAELSLPH